MSDQFFTWAGFGQPVGNRHMVVMVQVKEASVNILVLYIF